MSIMIEPILIPHTMGRIGSIIRSIRQAVTSIGGLYIVSTLHLSSPYSTRS